MFIDERDLYKKETTLNKNNKSSENSQSPDIESRINDLLRIMMTQKEHAEDTHNSDVQYALHTSLAFLQNQIEAERHINAYTNATNNTKRYLERLRVLKKLDDDINTLCLHIEQQEQLLDSETINRQRDSNLENSLQQIRRAIQPPQTRNTSDVQKHESKNHESNGDYDNKVFEVATEKTNIIKQSATDTEDTPHPTLDVCMFGEFRVSQNQQPIIKWSNTKAKMLFKYMVMNRKRAISKEILMDIFWPDINPQAARNNLNVTLYYLRKTLPKPEDKFSHILFKDDRYYFNPNIHFRVDVDAFRKHMRQALKLEDEGKIKPAIQQYKDAEALYQGEFLANDPYEEWASPLRNEYEDKYLLALNKLSQHYSEHKNYDKCISISRKILEIDCCDEAIHLRLIGCYFNTGRRHLAIRQYKTYETVLKNEMGLKPSKKATELLNNLMR